MAKTKLAKAEGLVLYNPSLTSSQGAFPGVCYSWEPNCQCEICVKEREERAAARAARVEKEFAKEAALRAQEVIDAFESKYGALTEYQEQFTTRLGYIPLRSQKARGVSVANSMGGHHLPYWLRAPQIEVMLPQQAGSRDVIKGIEFPIFARPCPTRPRHGFVESREVHNERQLLTLLCETLQADPLGEVMLMKKMTGKASAVATNSGVVWGKGNDGVTASHGEQFIIPVPQKKGETISDHLRNVNSALKKDIRGSVFIEAVENKGHVCLVQMRDGPADIAVGGNYVPHPDYKVTDVIEQNEHWEKVNLLEWEKTIMAAPQGTAVFLHNGSLTSHLAVHALAKKLAVITDKRPEVGDVLQPASDQPAPLCTDDYRQMAKLYRKRLPGGKKSRAAFAVSTLHAMALWGADRHLLWMRVAGAHTLARLLVAACVGEARHFNRCGPGARGLSESALPWKMMIGHKLPNKNEGEEVERSRVLERVFRYSIKTQKKLARLARKDFLGDWGHGESKTKYDREGERCGTRGSGCSFGGKKWAEAARLAGVLCAALIAFEEAPGEENWQKVMLAYNTAVCAVHNGGKLLNKWADWDEIDAAARYPQFGMLSPQAMFICTGVRPSTEGLAEYRVEEAGLPAVKKNPKVKKFPGVSDAMWKKAQKVMKYYGANTPKLSMIAQPTKVKAGKTGKVKVKKIPPGDISFSLSAL